MIYLDDPPPDHTADNYLVEALEWLYRREQNVTISSFWDGGWTFALGDQLNGFHSVAEFHDLTDGAAWLLEQYEAKTK